MIVSWNWLKEYVRLDMPLDRLIDRLVMSGLNLEETHEADGDIAIDFEVTSNRPDCLGHLGIAREVAVAFDRQLILPDAGCLESQTPVESLARVTIRPEAAAWCPQYCARVITGVKVGPSPVWMQNRLRAVGQNPINNVVDITNYVLLECGQPLHAFDYDKLIERRIVVRNAQPGERFHAINNRIYELDPTMGVIADAQRAVAIAGIMGGADTEVSNATASVLLEAAEFSALSIRRTARALDLSSDSSYRFERKIDPAGVAWAANRACHLLATIAGGAVARGSIHLTAPIPRREPITLRWDRIAKILGIEVPRDRAAAILARLGLEKVAETAEHVSWSPPTFRRDLTREIDLIEEIGRVYGYESVPENQTLPLAIASRRKSDRVLDRVRDLLGAGGFCEAVTFSFTDQATVGAIRPWSQAAPLAVRHSSRRHENQLRQSLLPSLLVSYRRNEARGNDAVDLFEVAQIFLPRTGANLPDEPLAVGLVSGRDVRRVRGHLEHVFESLRVRPQFSPSPIVGLAEGQSAVYCLDNRPMAVLGVVSDAVREQFEIRSRPVVAEFLFHPLMEHAQLTTAVLPIADQPAIVRDLAFVLDERVRWAELESLARSAAGPELERLEFVDLYRGKQIEPGKKSIAIRLTYRSPVRTLTHAEVDENQQKVIDAVACTLSGHLR